MVILRIIYISGRINNFPRTAKEIAAISFDNTSATRVVRMLNYS